MNDHAYDISYLLDADSVVSSTPVPTMKRAESTARAAPTLSLVQDTLARELLQAAALHEELIQQYMRISDGSESDWGK